jgi:signal transduction histidine kinase
MPGSATAILYLSAFAAVTRQEGLAAMTNRRPSQPTHDLSTRDRQIEAVHHITRLLAAQLDVDDRLRDILDVSMGVVEASAGSILLYREADDRLVFRHVVGPDSSRELLGHSFGASEGIAGQVFRNGAAVIENAPADQPAHRADIGEAVGFTTRNMVTVPLVHQAGTPVGIMQLLNKRSGGFDDTDLAVLEIVAAIAATAILNADLHRRAEQARIATAVGDLSHDIKNKVAPIYMAAVMLKPDLDAMFADLDAVLASAPEDVRGAVNHAARYVRRGYAEQLAIVLDQVQIVQEHTKRISDVMKGISTEPNLEMTDVAALVADQLRELEPLAKAGDVALHARVDASGPCRVDRFFMRSAIFNLVNNAIPETPPGGSVTVDVRCAEDAGFPCGRCLIIEVADTGKGMPPHVLERILRGDPTSTKKTGTGLGTRIVFNAARAHKGRLEGQSEEGRGTVLRLRVPFICD